MKEMKQVYDTILAAIGRTPIVRLNRVAAHVITEDGMVERPAYLPAGLIAQLGP